MPFQPRTTTQRRTRLSQNLVPENAPAPHTQPSLQSEVELLDVTCLDVRCVIDANPEIGDTVSFDVQRDGGRLASISGMVHWKEIRRNGYEVGMYLPSGLPAGMSGLMTDVRRKGNRYRCRRPGMFCRQGTPVESAAVVVNYSYDGFAVQTEAFCNIDENVSFVWTFEQRRFEMSGQVLWQIEQEYGVLLGCQTEPGVGYRVTGVTI
jgi:hypothetical protein